MMRGMPWTDPDFSFIDSTAGALFAGLKSVCAPAGDLKTGALLRLEDSVNGRTPGKALDQMHAGADTVARAGRKFGVGETLFNKAKNAVAKWRADAPRAEELNGLEVKVSEAYRARTAEIAKEHPDDAELDRLKTALDTATENLNTKVTKRNETDAAAEIAIHAAEKWAETAAASLGIEIADIDRDKGTPGAPSGPSSPSSPGAPSTPGWPGTPAPRMSPSATPGDVPGGTPEKSPAAQDALKKLLAENPPQQQVQQPQQQQPTAAAPMATPSAAQSKPAEKKAENPLDRLLSDAGIAPPADLAAPAVAAAVVPDAAPVRAPIDPPAPKPQVGGGSFTNGTTTANTSGGQNRAQMVLSSATPTQETVHPGQRTGTQPMGQGGVMPPVAGAPAPQSGAKEQPKVSLYRRESESERIARGAYAIEEAVKGGTLLRNDHDDDTNQGPRKR
ncbi:MAG: hypothetical protein KDB70_04130 [Mycobacterium sp.]|nr:hypothetical protein [Mycobacterium sp.]